jgi:hypothetical protein
MKKIVLSLAAIAAISSGALAESAYDKQIRRNMIENPENYSFPQTRIGVHGDAMTSGNALEVLDYGNGGPHRRGIGRFAGPGEDGRQGR